LKAQHIKTPDVTATMISSANNDKPPSNFHWQSDENGEEWRGNRLNWPQEGVLIIVSFSVPDPELSTDTVWRFAMPDKLVFRSFSTFGIGVIVT
jgi:hypothetical protein